MHKRHRFHYAFLILFLLPLVLLIAVPTDKSATQSQTSAQNMQSGTVPTTTVIAKNLEIPWALAFLPDGNILVTERPGRVKLVVPSSGQVTDVATISEVQATGEGGLLGIAVHPQFATNNFVYVYYTYGGSGSNLLNRLVRYTYANNQFTAPMTLVDAVPGGTNHDGGRIKFGPDGFLYITTGEAGNPSLAQDQNSLAGKILRVTDAGQPAPGNPFNTRIYSYGHRNPQGIAWNGTTLYETEHGNSSPSRSDEVNMIEPGKNYGWPTIEGDASQTGLVTPLANSGPDGTTTWAPSGTAFFNGSLFFSGLKGQALYEAKIEGTKATIVNQHLKGQLGRLREAIVGPDNQLYITTSNRDGRGSPKTEDDKIIRVSFGTSASPGTPVTSTAPVVSHPPFGVIAPCPSCVSPETSIIPSQSVMVTSGIAEPSQVVTSPAQTIDPCQNTDSAYAEDNKSHGHKKHNGGVSGIMDVLIKFILALLTLLLQVVGGGQIITPTPTPLSVTPDPGPC